MDYTLNIRTKKGVPDSLKQSVKIAFTLTPVESRQRTFSYDTLARWVGDFSADGEATFSATWGNELALANYEIKGGSEARWCDVNLPGNWACRVLARQSRTLLVPPRWGQTAQWSPSVPYSDEIALGQRSVMAINGTGESQQIALLIKDAGNVSNYEPIAVYQPIGNQQNFVAPSELVIQAYVVSDPKIRVNSVLRPEDMTHPLFPVPFSCGDLFTYPTWWLSQDASKELKLKNNNLTEPIKSGVEAKVDALARSFAQMNDRLAAVEITVARAQDDFASGQQSVHDIREQLSALQESVRRPPAHASASSQTAINEKQLSSIDPRLATLETKTDKLAKSFGQTQEYLSSVQKFLQTTKQQVSGLDRRVPEVEARGEKLVESVSQTREDLSAIKESLRKTEGQLMGLDHRVTAVEARSDKVLEAFEHARSSGTLGCDDESEVTFPGQPFNSSFPPAEAPLPTPSSPSSLEPDLPILPEFGT